jgi:hypothetical protein
LFGEYGKPKRSFHHRKNTTKRRTNKIAIQQMSILQDVEKWKLLKLTDPERQKEGLLIGLAEQLNS